MRKILLLATLFAVPSFAVTAPVGVVRFVEPIAFFATNGLPSELQATFQVRCDQTFLSVIRNEITHPTTGKVTISIGGLVSEDPALAFCSSVQDMVVSAGHLYSGRDFEVNAIVK
jgi:hypothetical protein